MSSDEIAIRVRDVSKHYLLFGRPQDRLKQSIVPRLQRLVGRTPKRYYRDFAALSDVSFDVKRGETVGVIGRNGSGKSTLLQVICGTLRPNIGTVEVNGRIAALLELGAGFNPEFTGRENVFMNGAILGLSHGEIDSRFDAIARFAGIGDFIEQPVKTYSSGMYVRLAFATAINVDPDILVIDEALAVGDEAFQRKCFARIEQIQERGGTILFVSHNVQAVVQLCTRALLIDGGELILDRHPKLVTNLYQKLLFAKESAAEEMREEIRRIGISSHDAVPGSTITLSSSGENETVSTIATVEPARVASSSMVAALSRPEPSMPELNDFSNPDLVSIAVVEYQSNGAVIRDIRIVNAAGESVNMITQGRKYDYQYDVEILEDIQIGGFGMAVRDVTGYHLFGQSSSKVGLGRSFRKGQRVTVSFPFVNLLAPGVYFGNAGMGKYVNNEVEFAHRIVDGFCFRVLDAGADTLCSSIINLKAGPAVIIDLGSPTE